jgi:hypothetical protein
MAVPEIVNVARRFLSLCADWCPYSRRRSFSRALNLFSSAGFFGNHDSKARKSVNKAKRQSNFGSRGVNALIVAGQSIAVTGVPPVD